jgi:hypothetical protein
MVIKDATRFRVFWSDRGKIRVDDGTYEIFKDGDGEVFEFTSGGQMYPWKLLSVDKKSMDMSNPDVGRRTFQRVSRNDENPLAGNWDVRFTTDRGRTGTARMYLYKDGMYVIDENDQSGRVSQREYGGWTGDVDAGTLSISFPHRDKVVTVEGKVGGEDFDHITWQFTAVTGEVHTYRCERRAARRP